VATLAAKGWLGVINFNNDYCASDSAVEVFSVERKLSLATYDYGYP